MVSFLTFVVEASRLEGHDNTSDMTQAEKSKSFLVCCGGLYASGKYLYSGTDDEYGRFVIRPFCTLEFCGA